MKIELDNDNIMVEEIEVSKEDTESSIGLEVSEETLNEDQVAQGKVIESCVEKYKKDDVIMFHKVIPVDVHMKYNTDDLKTYWFIDKKDVICKIQK